MKSLLVVLSSAIMAAYVVYRGFVTLMIMPFAVPLLSPYGMYFLLLVLIAAVSTVLSFTTLKRTAVSLASVVGLMALSYWVFFVGGPWRIWSEFTWLVVPELCFTLAGLCKWWVTRSRTLPEAELGKVLE